MKRLERIPTQTLIYAGVVVVLAIVFVIQQLATTQRNTIDMPKLPDTISKITVEKGGETVAFTRQITDGSSPTPWVVGDGSYPADQSKVNGILDAVTSAATLDVLTESGDRKAYGLVDDKHTMVTFYSGDKKDLTLEAGDRASAGSSVYARINDGREVVLLPGTTLASLTTKTDDFRDKAVVTIASADVVSLRASGPGLATVDITRASTDASTATSGTDAASSSGGSSRAPAWNITSDLHVDPASIDDAIGYLDPLRADGFLDKAPTGTPFATLVIGEKSGQEKLSFFPKNADGNYPVTSTSYGYPFYLSEWRAKRVLLGLDDYFAAFAAAK